jgi:hypothetical protein
MDMCVCRSHDAQRVTLCEIEVAIDVPLRVDDDGLTCSRAANQVRKLGKFRIGHLPNEHDSLRAVRAARHRVLTTSVS